MIGETVRVRDTDLLKFFYPSFVERQSLTILDSDKDVIYTGRLVPNLLKDLQIGTRRFINTAGTPDYDLTNTKNLLAFVYSRRGKPTPKYVLDILEFYDESELITAIKYVWVAGHWPLPQIDEDLTVYDLFKSVLSSTPEALSTFFSLLRFVPFHVIEASFITFLTKVDKPNEQNVSPKYQRLINSASTQIGHRLKPALMEYASTGQVVDELRFVQLILSLKS